MKEPGNTFLWHSVWNVSVFLLLIVGLPALVFCQDRGNSLIDGNIQINGTGGLIAFLMRCFVTNPCSAGQPLVLIQMPDLIDTKTP